MNSPRDLRRRIRSVTSTAQITRAMQMVAASKMRKAQERALAGRPFVRLFYVVQRELTTRLFELSHPLLEVRPVRKRAVILIATDKGLCGALNTNLFRLVTQFDPSSTVFITAGRKAAQFIARTHRQLAAEFTYGDIPRYPEARTIAGLARDMFLKREVDEVHVVATRFVNTLAQQPLALEFLPVGEIKGMRVPGWEPEAEKRMDDSQALFEPGKRAVLDYLLSHYLNIYIYQVLLNARASEQSARMVSMKNATDNAEDLIKDLSREYNKLRQGNITKELLEIAGGESG
ncbi:MAG TPA: ATP synthase F1 subunit gamma [Candidatus Angelobacter sp.]